MGQPRLPILGYIIANSGGSTAGTCTLGRPVGRQKSAWACELGRCAARLPASWSPASVWLFYLFYLFCLIFVRVCGAGWCCSAGRRHPRTSSCSCCGTRSQCCAASTRSPFLIRDRAGQFTASFDSPHRSTRSSPTRSSPTPASPRSRSRPELPGGRLRGPLQRTTPHRSRDLQPPRPDQPVADLTKKRTTRRPALGGLINEYERAA